MNKKKPFSKDKQTKISFSELMDLIGTTCDYKFCIVDENIDEELMELAAKHGIKNQTTRVNSAGLREIDRVHLLLRRRDSNW